uniref:Dihydrolipoyllysine-residue succinyltransferase component of 2-oxoglutarate dehydrogenase complex, mitochondrial n=1 Tax=Glossina pallidipes TaxID=7398 RepID=A0A1A9Z150_GLOPL
MHIKLTYIGRSEASSTATGYLSVYQNEQNEIIRTALDIAYLKVPDLPESVTDATVSNWKKNLGDFVESGEILVELETDKVVLEVPSPDSGKLVEIYYNNSELVSSRQKLASLDISAINKNLIKEKIKGLKDFPEINATIDGEDIVYRNYFNINIAVSTPKGLVTPVLKYADKMSIIDIETKIKDFAIRGKNNKLSMDDLEGGGFTITNGGIFGSMLSTPIINPPQSAILGIHAIKDRAVVIDKKIVITPMTYLALSYDHRLIDGKEAASFLVTVKNMLENPIRMLLNI